MKKIGLIGTDTVNNLIISILSKDFDICTYKYMDSKSKFRIIGRIKRLIKIYSFIRKTDIVYVTYVRSNISYIILISKMLRRKIIIHWAGSDVIDLTNGIIKCKFKTLRPNMMLAYSKNLQNELMEKNIKSHVLVIPPKLSIEEAKMPEDHNVLLSIPDDTEEHAEFYGRDTMLKLISKCKNIKFTIIRSNVNIYHKYENVNFVGLIDQEEMEKLYNTISIVIRHVEHDGTSLIIMESLIKGKTVLYNHDFPFTVKFSDFNELCIKLEKMVETKPEINICGRDYALENFQQKDAKSRLLEIINKLYFR